MLCFGVNVKEGLHNQLDRENYAIIDKTCTTVPPEYMQRRHTEKELLEIFEDTDCLFYNDKWCEKHREKCLKNFDLNMEYISRLDTGEFEVELNKLLTTRKRIRQIFDLNDCNGMSGIYIMVMDKYKQVYIGQSRDIKRRVMRHWSTRKEFDRLIFGNVENSILSIDCYGAKDTTRIYVFPTNSLDRNEQLFVRKMDKRFLTNRTAGGLYIENNNGLEILANMNTRSVT